MSQQQFLNKPEDCQWLRETHLKDSNLNNANPIPDFKSFALFGNEDCPQKIIVYQAKHPTVTSQKYATANLMDNGCYSFIKS
jgi:hypothetical protein